MPLPQASNLRICTVVVALALACAPTLASAQSACDADTQARLDFLETKLEEGRGTASWWWKGWLATFTIGAAVQGTKAALPAYAGHDADLLASSAKSLLGVASLSLQPLVAKDGADAARAIPADSADNCARRLETAEHTLAKAAEQARTRYSWVRHISSLVLNTGAAVVVDEVWNDRQKAWESFAVSEVFSEIHIWSQPWRAIGDWNSYRARFDGAPAAGLHGRLLLAALPRGLSVVWAF